MYRETQWAKSICLYKAKSRAVIACRTLARPSVNKHLCLALFLELFLRVDIDVVTEFTVLATVLSNCSYILLSYASCIGYEVSAMIYVLMIYV